MDRNFMAAPGWKLSSLKLFAALTFTLTFACAPQPGYRSPAIGEVMVISRELVKQDLRLLESKPKAIKLNIIFGDRPISVNKKGDPELRFIDQQGQVRYRFKWSQLEQAYTETDCGPQEGSYLDGYLMGTAMICDGSLSLKNITSIEGEYPGQPILRATSWGLSQLSEGLISATIGLF